MTAILAHFNMRLKNTDDVELYTCLYVALTKTGLEVRWKKEGGRILGDLEHLFAQILVWPAPWGGSGLRPPGPDFHLGRGA
ncbi:MAG: hypothetical protein ACUVUP_00580 [Thermaceae bacterium]